ncbi:hypothetical protein [Raineyella fluvialis]|uniref:Uncharacterized protein n=1 Tax=Raineyella fluvialis TaxID=2662261 RepID=A0A5Q2F6H5_9ACTN|nr:hypothetical protein [Raineyella fluvialis]QGF22572.1 hypothetical protein Rai3103_01485 [Raineyella fluvialis]
MMNARRSLGFGLALFGLGTAVALTQAGPGGQYKDAVVTTWVGRDHWVTAFVMAYVGVAAALALLVVAHHARTVLGSRGGAALERLATVGATLGAAGWMLSGGISVALAEGDRRCRPASAIP